MKTGKKIALLVVALVIAAAVILYFRSGEKTQALTFVTAEAQFGYIAKTVTATGSIEPVDTVAVGAQVSGVVTAVYVDFNSVVKTGQLLAKIDATMAESQAEQSKANLATANSNMEYQQSNFDRQSQLFSFGAISKADYQLAVNQRNNAKAALHTAKAQLALSKKNLSYTTIYSPINGMVLNRNVSAGQTIASSFNSPTLFVIAKSLINMQVRANVDEADIGGVRSGQNATFTVDAFPNDLFEGTVHEILLHPAKSANVVSYVTLINVDNEALKLKPGMTASINIFIEEDTNALLIPSMALNIKPDSSLLKSYKIRRATRTVKVMGKIDKGKNTRQPDTSNKPMRENTERLKSYVWIKTGDTLTEKEIITGLNDGAYVTVLKGLSPGEAVITNMVAGDSKSDANGTQQRSPFMPQMPKRPSRNSKN